MLLIPSPSALRLLLSECEIFARYYGLVFNANKTQLICFRLKPNLMLPVGMFRFLGHPLCFMNSVIHLGHILQLNLDDKDDINRVSLDMCRKANDLLHVFKSCDPTVKTFLFTTHCLSLYGAISWSVANKQLRSLEVAFNKIWILPMQCHAGILHCVAQAPSVINRIVDLFTASYLKASANGCPLIRHIATRSRHVFCTLPSDTTGDANRITQKNYDLLCSSVV